MTTILLVDDEIKWLESFKKTLVNYKITAEKNIFTARTGAETMEILSINPVKVVFLDLILDNESGENILKQIKTEHPEITVVIMTGINDVQSAVNCMKGGASDYLVKTVTVEEHITNVKRIIAVCDLQAENEALKKSILSDYTNGFEDFITCAPSMFAIFKYLSAVSVSKEPILICGENGVGKGVLAQSFAKITRPNKPFISVNIAGLDEQIFSDTLFGHIKGAYTGAENNRSGLIMQAADGILFMDEIGELPLNLQLKLLYLLQDRVYQQLGSDNILHSNARIILATNEDLKKKKDMGAFRKDLFYRINIHSVTIPPLRERKCDIPLLFEHFLKTIVAETGIKEPFYDDKLIQFLMNCSYPGNVRQLRSVTYNAMLKGKSNLTIDDFAELKEEKNDNTYIHSFSGNDLPTVDEIVNKLIYEAMRRSGNNQRKAATLIGLSQSTLSRKLRGGM